ncbi:hypothetical protein ABE073_04515 [Lederbergia citrisecunda]|uniref:hypothetical protein n=1 Tax=Lederbergia citrisecunda TaxID=2833583 RepID=UPI003D27AA65
MNQTSKNEWKNTWVLWLIGITLLVWLIGIVFVNEWENIKNKRDACADIGGKYEVVGKEFSAAHKTTVDVYGCVK